MHASPALVPARTPLQLVSRPFALLLAMLLAMTTVALGAGTASAAVGGPEFGPATTASMYSGEYAMITDFVPVGGSNTTVRQTSGDGLSFLTIDNQGRVFGTPPSWYAGTMDFTLLAEDDTGKTDTTTFTLTVYNRPTFYSSDTAEFQEDVESEFNVLSNGYPEPVLSATGLPDGFTLEEYGNGNGKITGKAALGTSGSYPVELTSAIPGGPSTTQNLTLNISLQTFGSGMYANLGGNGQVGSPLTVTSSASSPEATSTTYEWFRNGEAIAGATNDTYTPDAADLDRDIHAVVTVHRDGYADSSDATEDVTIGKGFMEWTQYPHVQGDPGGDDRVDSTVTVDHGTLDPEADSYSYQWFRNSNNSNEAIDGATDADYTLTPADADAGFLTVVVTAYKDGYFDASSQGMVSVRDADFASQPTLTIDGEPEVGNTVTVETTDADPAPDSTELKWFRDGEEFANEGNTYTVVPSDVGTVIKVEYSNLKDGYVPAAVSQEFGPQLGHFAADPVATVTGDPIVGSELSVDVDPLTPDADTLTYEWNRDGETIDDATGSTYTLTEADAGKYVAVVVTAAKEGYWNAETWAFASEDVISGGTFTVAPVAHVSGVPQVGNELLAMVEATTPETEDVSYQWLRDGEVIPGATDESYLVTADDAGMVISVRVTTSASGFDDATTTSDATVPVTGSEVPENPAPTAPAKTFRVTLSARTPERGQVEVVRGFGLSAGEAYTMKLGNIVRTGHASPSGTLARSFTLPKQTTLGRKVVTVQGSQTNRVGRAHLTVVEAKRLTITKASSKVRAGSKVWVRVSGLASGEHVLARYRGKRLTSWTPRANGAGMYIIRFNVGRALGKRPFVVRGSHPNRIGSTSFTVRR